MSFALTLGAMLPEDGLMALVAPAVAGVRQFSGATQHAGIMPYRPSPVATATKAITLLGVMQATVFASADNLQVLWIVVGLVAVDVVDKFFGGQLPTDNRLDYQAMLTNPRMGGTARALWGIAHDMPINGTLAGDRTLCATKALLMPVEKRAGLPFGLIAFTTSRGGDERWLPATTGTHTHKLLSGILGTHGFLQRSRAAPPAADTARGLQFHLPPLYHTNSRKSSTTPLSGS